MNKNKITVTYKITAEVTEIVRGVSEEFLKTEYPSIIKEKLENKMDWDNVNIKNFKIFVGDTE